MKDLVQPVVRPLPRLSRAMILAVGVLAVVGAACVAPVVYAQDALGPEHDARLHFELGQSAYARADYEAAAREFEVALALVDRPELHYNLFLVYHELDRDGDAAAQLRAYLPHETDPAARSYLEARLARLEEASAAATVVVPPDPARDTDTPPPRDAAAPGAEVIPTEPTAAEPTTSGSPTGEVDPLAIVLLASGGALVLAAIGPGIAALDDQASLDRACAASCPSSVASVQERGRALALASDVLWIGGAAVLAAGLVWAIVSATQPASSPTAALSCGPDGCLVVAGGAL